MTIWRFYIYKARDVWEGLMLNSRELMEWLHGLLKFEFRLQVVWNGNRSQGLDGGGLFAFVSGFTESILHVYQAEDVGCLQGSDSQFLLRCQNCRRQNWLSSRGQLTLPVMQQPPSPRLAASLWLLSECGTRKPSREENFFKKKRHFVSVMRTDVGLRCHICFRYPGYSSEPYAKGV